MLALLHHSVVLQVQRSSKGPHTTLTSLVQQDHHQARRTAYRQADDPIVKGRAEYFNSSGIVHNMERGAVLRRNCPLSSLGSIGGFAPWHNP
eukprot:4234220-Amphidinium_carterae.1